MTSTPLIISINFVFHINGGPNKSQLFLFEPEENATSDWLNDNAHEFNSFFRMLARHQGLESGAITISWRDGITATATLPMPLLIDNRENMASIGDLIQYIAEIMIDDDDDQPLFSESNPILQIAQQTGRLEAAKEKLRRAQSSINPPHAS